MTDDDDDEPAPFGLERAPTLYYARSLDELVPEKVADQALDLLMRYAVNLTLDWHPRIDWPSLGQASERSDFHSTVKRLVAFAQRGLPIGDWTHPDDVEEPILRVVHRLYSSPVSHGPLDHDVIDHTSPRDAYDYVHLALIAAVNRWRVLALDVPTRRGVNALASCVDEEWPDDTSLYLDPEDAASWLAKHGVPGFSKEQPQ